MANYKMVRDMLDLKLLILYALKALPAPVDSELLFETCCCDDGVQYFDYSQCLQELVGSGHVNEKDDEYIITDKGRRNAETVCSSLPFSVRKYADDRIEPVAEMLERYNLIKAEHSVDETGCTLSLSLSDGEIRLLELKLFCGDEKKARLMKKNFRHNAEEYYHKILSMLSDDEKKADR